MILVSNGAYQSLAQQLHEEIDKSGYYSGVITITLSASECEKNGDDGFKSADYEVSFSLITSLIIYHDICSAPDGDVEYISNIVPVWVEFHSLIDGVECENDFNFCELKNCICSWG